MMLQSSIEESELMTKYSSKTTVSWLQSSIEESEPAKTQDELRAVLQVTIVHRGI